MWFYINYEILTFVLVHRNCILIPINYIFACSVFLPLEEKSGGCSETSLDSDRSKITMWASSLQKTECSHIQYQTWNALDLFSVAFPGTDLKQTWRSPCFIYRRHGSLCFRFILFLYPGRTPGYCRAAADPAFRFMNRTHDTEMNSPFSHRMLDGLMLLTFSAVCTQAACTGFNGNMGEQSWISDPCECYAISRVWGLTYFVILVANRSVLDNDEISLYWIHPQSPLCTCSPSCLLLFNKWGQATWE